MFISRDLLMFHNWDIYNIVLCFNELKVSRQKKRRKTRAEKIYILIYNTCRKNESNVNQTRAKRLYARSYHIYY